MVIVSGTRFIKFTFSDHPLTSCVILDKLLNFFIYKVETILALIAPTSYHRVAMTVKSLITVLATC